MTQKNTMKQRAGRLILAATMLLQLCIPVQAASTTYSDISGNWAEDTILEYTEKGIVSGNGDGTFSPNANVTREEFAKILDLNFGATLSQPSDNYFSDVPSSRWSFAYVETARAYMTGYTNPFGGKPTFQPTTDATREDIAVALVKIMGLTSSSVQDANYVSENFTDYSDISPSLRSYVTVAAEQGLLHGYSDGSLRPTAAITRAEVLTMLSRASKAAVSDINTDIKGEATIIYDADDPSKFTVRVIAPTGSVLSVNDKTLATHDWTETGYTGYIYGECGFQFSEEGSQTLQATITYQGKTKTIDLTATYAIGAPVITFDSCPATTSTSSITISGKVTDQNSSISSFQINGSDVSFSAYSGTWSKTVTLSAGENKFIFTATNSNGKTTTKTRTVTFADAGPVLTITQCPDSVTTKSATIYGTLTDANYSVSLTVNGKSVSVRSYADGDWSTTVDLQPGSNTFKFIGTNSKGQTATETRTITYTSAGPVLSITQCPDSVTTKTAIIYGTLTDANYSVSLTVNGKSVSVRSYADGDWSTTVDLQPGANTFKFIGTNSKGQTATETRTITYTSAGPVLSITQCPDSVTTKSTTIEGTLTDANYSVSLTVNGKSVSVRSYANGDWSTTVDLSPGVNTFKIVGTNSNGQSVTETRTITFATSSPSFTFYNCPETTTSPTVTIEGAVQDEYSGTRLYINDSACSLDSSKSFSKTVTLQSGANTFVFRAVNTYGAETTVTKTIYYGTPSTSTDSSGTNPTQTTDTTQTTDSTQTTDTTSGV